jgi:hypothetical protein
MQSDQLGGDGQSQAGAGYAVLCFHAIEALEQVGQVFGANANARIDDMESCPRPTMRSSGKTLAGAKPLPMKYKNFLRKVPIPMR